MFIWSPANKLSGSHIQIFVKHDSKFLKLGYKNRVENVCLHNEFIEAKNLKTKENIDSTCDWTRSKQRKINSKHLCEIMFF